MRLIRTTSLAVATLALATACGSSSEPVSAPPTPAAVAFNDEDVMFTQMMIPHHEQAVKMADLAMSRAKDAEVLELADRIKAVQETEIQSMKGWLTSWDKPLPAGGMGHAMPGLLSEEVMKQLEGAKGKAFDKLFAKYMIVHHNGAIDMARTERADGVHAGAKHLASHVEAGQATEVVQLKGIVKRL
jgi:uncharacterized protein (DUF305 family)